MFLLQGNFDDKIWILDHIKNIAVSTTYYFEEDKLAHEIVTPTYKHLRDDIYEQVIEVKTIEEQYVEWCKEGLQHSQEDYEWKSEWKRFKRLFPANGFAINFNSFREFEEFCVKYDATAQPSKYKWEDGSQVVILTDCWSDE